MESVIKKDETFAVVFKVNLLRATLNEAGEFKDYLEEAIKGSDKDIIVNLSDCEHMDSTFLGVLVSSYKRLKKQNRNLVLIEPTDHSSIYLTLNSIGKIFPIYNNIKDALQDIENKKLLELELGSLEPISEKRKATVKKTDTTNLENKTEEKVEEIVSEMIEEKKEINTENFKSEIETLTPHSLPIEEKEIMEQELEVVENEFNLEQLKDLELKSDEKVTEEITSFKPDEEAEKVTETVETKIVTVDDDKPFKKGSVSWEFGF